MVLGQASRWMTHYLKTIHIIEFISTPVLLYHLLLSLKMPEWLWDHICLKLCSSFTYKLSLVQQENLCISWRGGSAHVRFHRKPHKSICVQKNLTTTLLPLHYHWTDLTFFGSSALGFLLSKLDYVSATMFAHCFPRAHKTDDVQRLSKIGQIKTTDNNCL